MRMVVCGASGFVGRQLVPMLAEAGVELLLVGRDPGKLRRLFPAMAVCGYDDIGRAGRGFDSLLNLAVLNNDAKADAAEFHAVNVTHLLRTVEAARLAGIARFVNVSSVHALDPGDASPYARSKRAAVAELENVQGIDISTIYLPLVYSTVWAGSLSFLNGMPPAVARTLFSVLKALKPSVHVSVITAHLLSSEPRERATTLSDGQGGNLTYRFVSRTVDLLFCIAVVLFLWWLLAAIWLLIRLDSPGPGLFRQVRVGRNRGLFTLLKFRTMAVGTRQAPTHETHAASLTRIGAPLRRWKLDELPQVWNVLRNEASLIGPRPCLPSQTELVAARERRGVFRLKPGITGLAQVNSIDMKDPELLAEWDQRYAALQCLLLDLRILLRTVGRPARGDRVAG